MNAADLERIGAEIMAEVERLIPLEEDHVTGARAEKAEPTAALVESVAAERAGAELGGADERLARSMVYDTVRRRHGREVADLVFLKAWPHPDTPLAAFAQDRNGEPYAPDADDDLDMKVEWLVDNVLPRGVVAVLSGPRSAGKSAWWQTLATEDEVLGFKVNLNGRILPSLPEGAKGTYMRLVARLADRDVTGAEAKALLDERIKRLRAPIFMNDPNLVDGLVNTIRRDGIELVVIDTWSRSLGADLSEIDNDSVNTVMADLNKVVQQTGCTVLVVHHFGHAADRTRGASALDQAADTVLHVKEKKAGSGTFVFRVDKQRDAPKLRESIEYRHESVPTRRVDGHEVSAVALRPKVWGDGVTTEALTGGLRTPTEEAQRLLCEAVEESTEPLHTRDEVCAAYNRALAEWCRRRGIAPVEVACGNFKHLLTASHYLVDSAGRGEPYRVTERGTRLLDGVSDADDEQE